MCTVTFIPTSTGFAITSNRDERVARKRAIAPIAYEIYGCEITFPKDPQAGGTWIAQTDNKVIVLLNGGSEKHVIKTYYRKSRGLIVLELASSSDSLNHWENIDLNGIEPFTIVLFENNKLHQLQWNEIEKTKIEFSINSPHIWSSSTLYSKDIRAKRERWFTDFMTNNQNPTAKTILDFHQFTESQNTAYGLQINRNNELKTISITQCLITSEKIEMSYLDLIA
ncbi:NRDE family protein [Flavobacterium ardleyense]|uniref:NRDE family protein n=1 Tax=Flavobacterium ardleyense TaxID=2038737 RepID=A0ABW5ZBL7_9FLAO